MASLSYDLAILTLDNRIFEYYVQECCSSICQVHHKSLLFKTNALWHVLNVEPYMALSFHSLEEYFMFTISNYIKSGIFFQSIIFIKKYDLWEDGTIDINLGLLANTPWGIVLRLLNGKKKLLKLLDFCEEDDAAGYNLIAIRWPVYFKREYRKLSYIGDNYDIQSIGYNYVDEPCGGVCIKEHSVVKHNGKVIFNGRSDTSRPYDNTYRFTYKHVIEDSIESDIWERLSYI